MNALVNRRVLGIVVVALALGVTPAASQVDFAGTWMMTVNTDNGITNPSMTLQQDGSDLTGSYSSDTLGRSDVRGSIDGSDFTISFSASLQGQSIPVVYRGTMEDDGTLSGSIDVADGMITGTFTATRD
ncbi:MAG: hypothetical protein AAF389_11845 [Gemmatimonadota bacterium]